MPDRDRQSCGPDSDKTTNRDRASTRGDRPEDLRNGSAPPGPVEPGSNRSRLALAVDNDSRGTPLREIVSQFHLSPPGSETSPAEELPGARERMFLTHEEAARRIAQDLHDDASQMLALVYLELSEIASEGSRATAERVEKVTEHLDLVCEQIRGLAHELHPRTLERHGLVPALHKLAEGVSRRTGLEVTVTADIGALPSDVELGLYRVAQEALSNVVRHANASFAEIRLWTGKNSIHCSVKDDGVGFQPVLQDSGGRYGSGLGLVGIYDRVDSLGGECHIRSGDQHLKPHLLPSRSIYSSL